jgi:hypothetical protein
MSQINKFISAVKAKGLARTNRYQVEFMVPGGNSDDTQLALLFCESTSLPGINIATQAHRVFGENRELPYERMYDPITLSFYVDADLKVKKLFDMWMSKIVNPTRRTFSYYNDYVTDMTIKSVAMGGKLTETSEAVAVSAWTENGIDQFQPIIHKKAVNEEDVTPYVVTLHECYPKTISSIQLDAAGRDIMKLSVTFQYKWWDTADMKLVNNKSVPLPATGQSDPQGVTTGTGTTVSSSNINNTSTNVPFVSTTVMDVTGIVP